MGMTAYDVESLPLMHGMSAWPQWCSKELLGSTWQHGLVTVESYNAATGMATIKGKLINNLELVSKVVDGTTKDVKLDEQAQFQ